MQIKTPKPAFFIKKLHLAATFLFLPTSNMQKQQKKENEYEKNSIDTGTCHHDNGNTHESTEESCYAQ